MGRQCQLSNRLRDIWMSNACVKFEERSLNPSKVIALTKLCGGGGPCGGCVAHENIIFPKTYVSREYNDELCKYNDEVLMMNYDPNILP